MAVVELKVIQDYDNADKIIFHPSFFIDFNLKLKLTFFNLKPFVPSSAQAEASPWAQLVLILIKSKNSTSFRKQKLLSSMSRHQNHVLT